MKLGSEGVSITQLGFYIGILEWLHEWFDSFHVMRFVMDWSDLFPAVLQLFQEGFEDLSSFYMFPLLPQMFRRMFDVIFCSP